MSPNLLMSIVFFPNETEGGEGLLNNLYIERTLHPEGNALKYICFEGVNIPSMHGSVFVFRDPKMSDVVANRV